MRPSAVIHCCITNYPKTWKLKTTNVFTVSSGQDFRSGLAGWLCPRASLEVAALMSTTAAVTWRLAWGPKIHFSLARKAVGKNPASRLLAGLRGLSSWHDLGSKVTHDHFCLILFVRSKLLCYAHVREGKLSSTPWREEYERICGHIFKTTDHPTEEWFSVFHSVDMPIIIAFIAFIIKVQIIKKSRKLGCDLVLYDDYLWFVIILSHHQVMRVFLTHQRLCSLIIDSIYCPLIFLKIVVSSENQESWL